jgi:endonuclease I
MGIRKKLYLCGLIIKPMLMNNKKFISLFYFLYITLLAVLAQGPNNSGTYYQAADGKKGEALKTAMFNIIKNHTTLSYSSLENYYHYTDERPDGCIRDWYSNITSYGWDQHGNSSEGAGWNKEHTVPQSWFNEASPMKSDIVHVVPTDAKINNMRSAYVIAEVGTVEKASANNYSLLGSCKTPGYSGKVFEPNDEIKGDVARIYFYMATCYQDKLKNWTKGEAQEVFTSSAYPGLQQWYLKMLFRWSMQDPVDDVEIARNNAVASGDVQGNRNPFVDYPGLEDYIWGNMKDEVFSYDNYAGPSDNPQPDTDINSNPNPDSDPDPNPDAEIAESCTIVLNNTFFDVNYTSTVASSNAQDFVGKEKGVTVVYALGAGQQRYINDSQIRLYPGNTLTFSVESGNLTEIEFTLAKTSSNKLQASKGNVSGLKWTGKTPSVQFSADGSSGHLQITTADVKVENLSTGIKNSTSIVVPTIWYDIQGQRVQRPTKGVYIVNGRKAVFR